MTTSASTPISRGAASIWSRSTVSWMLYDLANTIYSLNIVSLYFSLWIVNDMGGNDQLYGAINSFSMFLMFLSAPVIGALSDLTARRVPLLAVSTILCVLFTLFLGQGGLAVSLIFFILANYFYQAGLIFYDALLPAVSTDANRGRVSGIGVGVGYIGSFIGLGAGYYLLEIGAPKVAIFQTTAILFLLFALPCFLFVRERARADARPMTLGALRQAFGNVRGAIARARSYPGLGRFLLGRYFYTDAANTAMAFTAIYATNELGFTEVQTTLSLGVGIAAAIIGGFVWGSVVDRIGPKKTLQRVLGIWLVTFVAIILIPVLHLPPPLYYIAAAFAGIGLAGTWSADRPLMVRLSPPRYLGQLYGLYAMVGRFSAVIGPLMWGIIVNTLGLGRPVAIFSLFIMVCISYLILRPIDDEPRVWRPDELVPRLPEE